MNRLFPVQPLVFIAWGMGAVMAAAFMFTSRARIEHQPWRTYVGISGDPVVKNSDPLQWTSDIPWVGAVRISPPYVTDDPTQSVAENLTFPTGAGYNEPNPVSRNTIVVLDKTKPDVKLDSTRAGFLLEHAEKWIFSLAAYSSRSDLEDVDIGEIFSFYDYNHFDHCAAWRTRVERLADGLLTVLNAASNDRKIYVQIGNEVNGTGVPNNIYQWLDVRGLPYPHPGTQYEDRDGYTPNGGEDRGMIGYLVEYRLAPAIDALIAANNAQVGRDLIIMAPSYVGGRGAELSGSANNDWIDVLMNYKITGLPVRPSSLGGGLDTNAPYLSSANVRGRSLRDLCDVMSVHYVMPQTGVRNGNTVSLLRDRIVGLFDTFDNSAPAPAVPDMPTAENPSEKLLTSGLLNKANGIWHTEEVGDEMALNGRGAVYAWLAIARGFSLWLDPVGKAYDADNGFEIYNYNSTELWYKPELGPAPDGTKPLDAMAALNSFLPADSAVLKRWNPDFVPTSNSNRLECQAFAAEAPYDNKQVLVITCGSCPTTATDTWMSAFDIDNPRSNGLPIVVDARLWQTTGQAVKNITVSDLGNGRIRLTVENSVNLKTPSERVLTVFLN